MTCPFSWLCTIPNLPFVANKTETKTRSRVQTWPYAYAGLHKYKWCNHIIEHASTSVSTSVVQLWTNLAIAGSNMLHSDLLCLMQSLPQTGLNHLFHMLVTQPGICLKTVHWLVCHVMLCYVLWHRRYYCMQWQNMIIIITIIIFAPIFDSHLHTNSDINMVVMYISCARCQLGNIS